MRILLLTILLALVCTASAKAKPQNRILAQNPYPNYLNNMPSLNQAGYLNTSPKNSLQPSTPLRELSVNLNPADNLPDNIKLEKLMENYRQMQMMNQREDAEAADLNEDVMTNKKSNRGLKITKFNRHRGKRHLTGDEPKDEGTASEPEAKDGDNTSEVSEQTNKSETESEPEKGELSDVQDDNSGDSEAGDEFSIDSFIDRLLVRVKTIDDKVDHIMFHNGHDLAGMTAHYTPYGIQMLPSNKGSDSVDQKLKMIDYMHNLGGGYNPMLHTMLPYYLGQNNMGQNGIKMDHMYDMKLAGSRKKRLL